MNKEQMFDAVGKIDDDILAQHRIMDLRLLRKRAQKKHMIRVLAIAACLVLAMTVLLSVAALAHPVTRAVMQRDSEALNEYLLGIDGFAAWREITAEKLEQNLPKPLWELVQTNPLLQVLTQSQFSGLTAQDTFEQGKPYHLYFSSNGDGTCTLRFITTDPAFTQNYVIEIPETSPEGDTVTAIDIGQLSYPKLAQQHDFPYVLTASVMNALCETAKFNGMNEFEYRTFTAYYLKLTLDGLDESARSEMLKAYPIVAFGDIYVFDEESSATEMNELYESLTTYCEWDEAKYLQNIDEILNMAKSCADREQAELCLTALRHTDLQGAVGISIPKTVSSIHGNTWLALSELKTITVAQNHPTFDVIDNCLIDITTGTLKRCLAAGGKIPEDAGIRIIDANAFAGCIPIHSVEGLKMVFHLYIPEGILEVKPDSFNGIFYAASGVMEFRVHLPASLRSFGSNPSNPVYYYAGTAQQWNDNVSMVSVRPNDYIYLYSTDVTQAFKIKFGE